MLGRVLNNLDRIYYSIKADFQMEPYLGTLHQGPLRTTWHDLDWASTGCTLVWAAMDQIECPMKIGGVNNVPQCNVWW